MLGFLLLTAASALQAPAPTRRGVARLMSWQPNENWNGQGEARLTDFERSAREAGVSDRTVTIRRPLGLVLDTDDKGDVFIKEVIKGGNADVVGEAKVGDVIAMCSATFGREMWSTRGVGLDRVMRAIEVRSGATVSLVLQSKAEQKNLLAGLFSNQKVTQEKRIETSDAKRKVLEAEIKSERKEASKGWFGLF